jgi:carbon monoxide dehydrogenase subunit G
MKFMKFLLTTIVGLVVTLVVVGIFLPSNSEVSRSTHINATPEKVFSYLNDFKQFNRWSPWARIDPDTQYQFHGPATGVGSKISWSSENQNVGSGSQEITLSLPNKELAVDLEFGGQGSGKAGYVLEPTNGATDITWNFKTEWGFNILGRYMGLMMDDLVGTEYEKGLSNLKQLVESE